jgi:4-amino-4-deoxy-L-arabinose transferase-like glycosyltransferase
LAVLGAILVVAAVLTFWRLGAIYLWQDEANTAVLAVRMLETGRPLAYDGRNLLTNDNFAAEDRATIGQRTTSAAAGVDYIVRRGDLKPDTSWIFHPWGQFVAAAAGIKLFGQTTLGPRLPFALAGFLTVLLLYWIVRRATSHPQMALMAAALLTVNAGWILHSRQARYYALSGFLLLVVLVAYLRWQRGARAGAVLFVAAAWVWFQVDYGTFWPVVGVLIAGAFVRHRHTPRKALVPAAILAATVAPFLFFYQMTGRLSAQLGPWTVRATDNLFYLNRYVVSVAVLLAAGWLLARQRRRLPAGEVQLVTLAVAILAVMIIWVPTVAPAAFLRYIVVVAPLGCAVTSWVLFRGFGRSQWAPWLLAAVMAITPWITLPLDGMAPLPQLRASSDVRRPELRSLVREVFVARRDPNRTVIDWLRSHTAPTDAILVNYEDAPLMYYLPNPIRGGIAAFRAEDHASGPPAVIILRRSVQFVHWPVFVRELNRYDLAEVPVAAPDVVWGNNPDPLGRLQDPGTSPDLFVARVRGIKTP